MKKIFISIITILISQTSAAKEVNHFSKGHTDAIKIYKHDAEIKSLEKKTKFTKNPSDQSFELEAERVAKELQDVLASKLLNTMYEGIEPNPLFGGGSSEKMFQSMLNDERAKLMDLGLVKTIKTQIIYLKNGQEALKKNDPK